VPALSVVVPCFRQEDVIAENLRVILARIGELDVPFEVVLVSDGSPDGTADLVAALLAFEPRIDVERLSREAALPPDRILRALARLASAGRVGYDLADAAYFHRELPYDPAVLEELHPRLRDARTLAEAGAVQRDPVDENLFLVESAGSTYVVRRSPTGESCTCPWYAKYRGDRGFCKHVLAVTMSMSPTPE